MLASKCQWGRTGRLANLHDQNAWIMREQNPAVASRADRVSWRNGREEICEGGRGDSRFVQRTSNQLHRNDLSTRRVWCVLSWVEWVCALSSIPIAHEWYLSRDRGVCRERVERKE